MDDVSYNEAEEIEKNVDKISLVHAENSEWNVIRKSYPQTITTQKVRVRFGT
ncbi:hypothetical protein KIN20_013348 [Parelaphostrongylus tenuis]|uniref:Uncharacterized protein n=1 Tax=Parelaphostrongylus tenuis TaxID=148309 RepID=A0AAD5MGI4_PARTN|nr:hypothetical protein KIN20_013348 [Parelaphostrongylus tenuis]